MVLMEWTDHSRRRFESWRISIFYRKWLQNTANQWLPCFWLSSFDRYSRHNSHYVACFNPIVTPFDSCIFFREALPRPTAKTTRGEGRGARRFSPPRVGVSFLGASAKKHSSRIPGERKR